MTRLYNYAAVCIGDKYPPEIYVENLWLGINQHTTGPVCLTVLTDQPDHPYYADRPIRTVQAPSWEISDNRLFWWYKMFLFSPHMELNGEILYLDLDTIIVGNMNKFFDYTSNFCICQDFNRKWIRNYGMSNSSVFKYNTARDNFIWEKFNQDRAYYIKKFRGDQDFITHYMNKKSQWWPTNWAMSFKWEIFKGGLIRSGTGLDSAGNFPADDNKYHTPEQPWILPSDCSIVVYHGKPNPVDTDFFRSVRPEFQQLTL